MLVFSFVYLLTWFRVVVGIIWIFISLGAVGIFPLWEGRASLTHNVKAIYLDVTGKKHPRAYHGYGAEVVESHDGGAFDSGTQTPTEASEKKRVVTDSGIEVTQ